MSDSKTAREALRFIQTSADSPMGAIMIAMMVEYLIKHFEAGKGLDEELEMSK